MLPPLSRLSLHTAAKRERGNDEPDESPVAFGPIKVADGPEGIAYELELPGAWGVDAPREFAVTRGSYATSVPTSLRSKEPVVVLIRPLDAWLPHEVDCPNREGSTKDCLKLAESSYEAEMMHVQSVVVALKGTALLPKLYRSGVVTGTTHNAHPDFKATRFGVQVWERIDAVATDYIRTRNVSRQEFIDTLMPLIRNACERLREEGWEHTDLHLDNVAFAFGNDDNLERCVFLDPASIKEGVRNGQCEPQSLVDEYDGLQMPPPPTCQDVEETRKEWHAAVGDARVRFKPWQSWTSDDKRRLVHEMARDAQLSSEDFVSVYEEKDIDDILRDQEWSVEHVLPRSKCPEAEGDVLNMTVATRSANSHRSNLPLVLWPDRGLPTRNDDERTFEGVAHFAPPEGQRARLARKWLCARATHACAAPMSSKQRQMLPEIVALAKADAPSDIERRVSEAVRRATGLRNPLVLDARPARWYDCVAWRALLV